MTYVVFPDRRKSLATKALSTTFLGVIPHPADKSALRAEEATHFLAPGKPGRPPTSTWPLFSRNSQFTTTSYDPSPLATAIHRLPDWVKIERGLISTIGLSL